ncbi:MAG: hypothetical protein NPINA01_00230 [Nitrospinaceae bacterium]|nr:MAG: hypothetical protein NPINA01_00230 [Nitrospinaceae bacterium]
MKRRFRFLLAFDSADGSKTVAEFDSNEEYLLFKKDLDEQGRNNKLVNEREFETLKYKGANYMDLRN